MPRRAVLGAAQRCRQQPRLGQGPLEVILDSTGRTTFLVDPKGQLQGVKTGDSVTLLIEQRGGQEIVTKITNHGGGSPTTNHRALKGSALAADAESRGGERSAIASASGRTWFGAAMSCRPAPGRSPAQQTLSRDLGEDHLMAASPYQPLWRISSPTRRPISSVRTPRTGFSHETRQAAIVGSKTRSVVP